MPKKIDVPILKLDNLVTPNPEFKPRSIYDLKSKIKDADFLVAIKFLLGRVSKCDIDSDVYFKLKGAGNMVELLEAITYLLQSGNSRKYDENARYILHVLKFLLAESEKIKP